MNKQIYFSNMFSAYEPPEMLEEAFSQAVVAAADIDAVTRRVSVAIHADTYIPARKLDQAAYEICQIYGMDRMEIIATFPDTELRNVEQEELLGLFVAENSMLRATLAGAKWEWDGCDLTIRLRANGKKDVEEALPKVQTLLREQFAAPVTIRVEAGKALEGAALFEAVESMKASLMKELPQATAAAAPGKKPESKPAAPSDTFYGKPIRGDVIPMKDLNLDMGFVIVEGRVFNIEHKELKKRNAWVISFDMTDNTNSIRINRFMEAGEAKPILDNGPSPFWIM